MNAPMHRYSLEVSVSQFCDSQEDAELLAAALRDEIIAKITGNGQAIVKVLRVVPEHSHTHKNVCIPLGICICADSEMVQAHLASKE